VVTAERRGWENKMKSSSLELMSLIQFENKTMIRRPPTTSWWGALIQLRTICEVYDPKAKTICTWASSLVGLLWLKNSVSARCLF
jgi:hypothetical protein